MPPIAAKSIGVAISDSVRRGISGWPAAKISDSTPPKQYPNTWSSSTPLVRMAAAQANGMYSSQYVSKLLSASAASGVPQSIM